MRWLALAVIVASVLASCDGATDDELALKPELVQGTWVLESLTVDGAPMALDGSLSTREIPSAPAWLAFDAAGDLAGEGPCNGFRGRYVVQENTVILSQVSMQATACVERSGTVPIMETEEAFLAPLLSEEARLVGDVDDSTLILEDGATKLTLSRYTNG